MHQVLVCRSYTNSAVSQSLSPANHQVMFGIDRTEEEKALEEIQNIRQEMKSRDREDMLNRRMENMGR